MKKKNMKKQLGVAGAETGVQWPRTLRCASITEHLENFFSFVFDLVSRRTGTSDCGGGLTQCVCLEKGFVLPCFASRVFLLRSCDCRTILARDGLH